jgi:hypothetical protein
MGLDIKVALPAALLRCGTGPVKPGADILPSLPAKKIIIYIKNAMRYSRGIGKRNKKLLQKVDINKIR